MMFYREAGDFRPPMPRTTRPFRSSLTGIAITSCCSLRFAVVPFVINDYWVNAVFLPFLIYAIAAIGLNILVGYCGQVSLGHRRVHGCGGLCLLQADDQLSGCEHRSFTSLLAGGDHGGGRRAVWPAVACGSRGSIWPWRRWRRSSFWSGCSTGCRGSTTIPPRARSARPSGRCLASPSPGPNTEAWATYLFCLVFVIALCGHCAQPDAGHAGAQMDGDPRYGHRR